MSTNDETTRGRNDDLTPDDLEGVVGGMDVKIESLSVNVNVGGDSLSPQTTGAIVDAVVDAVKEGGGGGGKKKKKKKKKKKSG